MGWFNWLWDWLSYLGLSNKTGKILFLGLDNAGKTTLLGKLATDQVHVHRPTFHPNVEELTLGGIKLKTIDMGGHLEARRLWKDYFTKVDGVVFIVDAANPERFMEAKQELDMLMQAEELARTPFLIFAGCPVSRGVLQPDMWGVDTEELAATSGLDWSGLRRRIREFGVRNSLLLAPMLTASSSQILGNTEATEPLTSNVYSRRAFSGDFQMVNSHLLRDLIGLGVWSEQLKTAIVANQGSIQEIEGIPDDIKALYKTVWEIPQKVILDMAADRGPFIDQSQTLNLYLREPTYGKVTSMHFYAWKRGLKTGMYYLRTRPAAEPIQFTVNNREVSVLLAKGFGKAVRLDDERPPDAQADRATVVVAEAYRKNLEVLDCSAETANCCLNCSS